MTHICLIIICIAFSFGGPTLLSPEDQDSLNYLHVPFKWSQESDAINYEIQISNDVEFDSIIYGTFQPHLLEFITDGFDWNNQYFWRVRSCYQDGAFSEWSNINTFFIKDLPDGLMDLNTVLYEPDMAYEGITVLDQLWYGKIFAIDLSGKVVWFLDSDQVFDDGFVYKLGFTYFLKNGNILGYADGRENNVSGRAFEMDINNNLVWQGPGSLEGIGVHHDVIRLSNGNTMALTSQDMLLPIPEADWPIEVEDIVWRGDRIIEWDQDGNQVWSWSCFDHFSQDDWDYGQILMSFGLGFYDWTHSNAIWYDEQDDAVYLSVRYLNRVTKIDYSTGNVIWNMGENTLSGDAEVGNDLNFSMQHSIKVLENRNLMIYDNGNNNNTIQSRGLEISVADTDSIPLAEIVWQYQLPDTLSSGKMSDSDRLPNGNSLLTSTSTSHILEVSYDSLKVWEILPYQNFSTYRGERTAGLFTQLFSVIHPNFIDSNQNKIISINELNSHLSFSIFNYGHSDQVYHYILEDSNGWYSYDGTVEILSGDSYELTFNGQLNDSLMNNSLSLSVYPIDAPSLIEVYTFQLDLDQSNNPMGDVNLDSVIDVLDIILIIDIILELYNPNENQLILADLNNDLLIDVLDVIMIVDIILS